jgi:SAM-dependent methyltransferase
MIAETIIGVFSREPEEHYGTQEKAPDNPIEVLEAAYPGLADLLKGKTVLDFGCGFGHQTNALTHSDKYECQVQGLEINKDYLRKARTTYPRASFIDGLDAEQKYDVVFSLDSMEHFREPDSVLEAMKDALRPGGLLLITFGPPWYAPYGSHMHFFCKLPWLNVIFPERAVMAVRNRFRSDGAQRYEDVESGLNKMSLRAFERLVKRSGLELGRNRYNGVKGLDVLTKIPVIRELCTSRVTVVLRKH